MMYSPFVLANIMSYFPFFAEGKMILLPFPCKRLNILYLCLSYSGMKYDTLPFLGERLP